MLTIEASWKARAINVAMMSPMIVLVMKNNTIPAIVQSHVIMMKVEL